MSQSKERLQALEKEYKSMPHGKARLSAIYGAIREADASGNRSFRIRSRYDALLELLFYGDGGKALPLAVEIINLFEEHPDYEDREAYLYVMSLAVGQWNALPQLPLNQWESLMERFEEATRRYQTYDGVYQQHVFYRAERQGQREKMEEAWEKWQRAKNFNSCPGCKQYFRLRYALSRDDNTMIQREARPLLDGTTPCDQEPDATLELLLARALEQGDQEDAERWGGRLRQELLKDSPVMEYDSDLLCWLACSGPEEGVRMLERAFPDQWQMWDQSGRFDFFEACWVLCRRLTRRGAPLLLELPKAFPLWRGDGRYDAGELADWFYQEAQKIARAFDTRDGYPFFAQSLEKAGRFFDWPGEKGKRLEVDSVEIELGRECDIDAWMKLVDSVKDSFPGLETREALEEHRNTVLDFISKSSAICAKINHKIVGALLFSRENSLLCFLAVDAEYRRRHIAEKMAAYMLTFMDSKKDVVVTTYREGVTEGIAARAFYKRLGFVEGRLTENSDVRFRNSY